LSNRRKSERLKGLSYKSSVLWQGDLYLSYFIMTGPVGYDLSNFAYADVIPLTLISCILYSYPSEAFDGLRLTSSVELYAAVI
jgi:hypothetical protein